MAFGNSSSTSTASGNYTTAGPTDDTLSVNIDGDGSKIAVITTIIFALLVLLTNGGLLLVFVVKRNTRKYLSVIQATNMANIIIGAFFDLTLRLPLFILHEDTIALVSYGLCNAMRVIPDYFMTAILLCLPLITAERLLKLINGKALKRNRHVVCGGLAIAYLTALVFSLLPLTDVFDDGSHAEHGNTRCADSMKYGHTSFAYTYSAITASSVLLTFIFSILILVLLRKRLVYQTSSSRKAVMKRGVVSSIVLTVVLFFATVPFAVALQLVLTCGHKSLIKTPFCDKILPNLFRTTVVVQKVSLMLLPLVFLKLNPTMRRKIWLNIRKPHRTSNIQTISSSTTGASVESQEKERQERRSAQREAEEKAEGNFITLPEELTCPPEVIRRMTAHSRLRQSFLDYIDIMSVISEQSETESIHSLSLTNTKRRQPSSLCRRNLGPVTRRGSAASNNSISHDLNDHSSSQQAVSVETA